MKYLILVTCIFFQPLIYAQPLIQADPDRMAARIMEIAKIGANPDGGVSRLAYSDADLEARTYVIGLMKEAGLEVFIDPAGNIIGKRKGSDPTLSSILFGSHIDSVPYGGNYDGVAGVISALECMELMKDNNIQNRHPMEVVVFTDEEGGLIGSMAMNGTLTEKDLKRISNSGKEIKQGIMDLGGDTSNLDMSVRDKQELFGFIELHIEQGAFLEMEGYNIGVVEGIVGIETWEVTIVGKANHAGTTPMNIRQDALLAASRLVLSVNEIVRSFPGSQVGTVGEIHVEPGASNVVPGRVTLTIELRDLSRDKIMQVFTRISERIQIIEKETDTKISYKEDHSNKPAVLDKKIKEMIAASARDLNLKYKYMPSGAGHDAQNMAKLTPTGMIFIPSKDGISHSPDEYSSIEDVVNGASVLFHTIMKMDKEF